VTKYPDPWKDRPITAIEAPHAIRMDSEDKARIWWAVMHVRDLAGRRDVDKQVMRAAAVAWMKDQFDLACQIVGTFYKLDVDDLIRRIQPRRYSWPQRDDEALVWDSEKPEEWLADDDDFGDEFDPDGDDPDEMDFDDKDLNDDYF
jgi:hypothetical protein